MAVSLEQFQEQLTSSGLMTAAEIDTFVESLGKDQQPANAEALAKLLVEKKQLTPFQAQQIWQGKGKHLVLGNYVIVEKLGQGGMGMVLKASHRLMKRDVALKVLSPAAVKNEMAVQRFLREVEAAAKLTHPNIVAAHDADQANGNYFLIMEYVEGRDLSEIVKKQGPAKIEQAIDCILQAARGLEYAHQHGVIHRDIKPANLLLDKTGTVKVLDMGLARIDEDNVDAATQAGLTGTGTIMGTIDYMAPEQAEDTKSAGPQADIYSLGASLYFLLTGKRMVKGDSLGKKLKMLMTGVGLPDSICPLRKEVPPQLDAIFNKMTAFDMADRYQTMTEVIADLEALQSGSVPSSASTPGIQPVAGRSDDSAMQSFLNKLDDGTVASGPTVMASPKTEVGAETMASSVDEATRPAFKKTATFTKTENEPNNRKLLIGSALAACLVIGALVWGLNRNGDEVPPSGDGNQLTTKSLVNETDDKTPEVGSVTENWALKFDGSKSHVRIPSLRYDGTTPLTMEAMVNLDENSQGPIISDVELGGVVLFRTHTGKFKFEGYGHNQKFSIASARLSGAKRWVHVAAVYDGQQVRLFVDGELQEATSPVTRIQPSIFSFVIGTNLNGTLENPYPDSVFTDEIDEIRISNSARYDKTFQPPRTSDRFASDEHTLALYHFDEGSETVLKDSSGNGHHGKIVGAEWVRVDAARSSSEFARIDLTDGEPGEALRIPHNVIQHPNSNHLGFLSEKLVLTASTNGTPATFRLRDGVPQRKLERAWFDDGKVHAIRFVQSSNHLFGGLTDGRACLWDIESGKIEKYFGERAEATQDNKTFALSVASDGKSVAVAQPHGLVRVWDVETGRQIGSRQMELQVRCAFLPGSQKLGLLSGAQLIIWDVAKDQIERTYPHGLAASTDFRISPDGRYAIACDGRRPAAFCLNLHTGEVRQFSSPDAPAYFSTISPDSRWLYAGGILYDLVTLQLALDLTKEANGNPDSLWRQVTYAPDGRFLVVHVYSEEKSKQGIVFWRLPEKFWPRETRRDNRVPPPAKAPFNEAQAKTHQKAWADHLGLPVEKQVTLPGAATMQFMLIPPGEFMMGATVAEQKLFLEQAKVADDGFVEYDRLIFEKNPLHRVKITQPFYIGKYEVTQREWQSVMKANPSRTKSPEHAVGGIAWNDVQPFLDKLNERPQLAGNRFALPTEAQWEYACRAGTTAIRHYGDSETALQAYGWFKANGARDAHRVGQLRQNQFGLYDMYGNVYEWCADRYDVNYYLTSPVSDPAGPETGNNRIVRGGSWNHPPRHCNSPHRGFDLPDKPFVDHGLRLVMTIDTAKRVPGETP